MALRRGHETDATVTMLVVVPGGELRDPLPGVEQVVKRFRWVLRAIFQHTIRTATKREPAEGAQI